MMFGKLPCKVKRLFLSVSPWRRLKSENIITAQVLSHLDDLKRRYNELDQALLSPSLQPSELRSLGREYAEIGRVMVLFDERNKLQQSIDELIAVEDEEQKKQGEDSMEMIELVRSEREELTQVKSNVEEQLMETIVPKDLDDGKGVVVEVRSGTGGDEASLFASEVFKMYQNYAAYKGWKWEPLSLSKSDVGGFKEAQASVSGESVYKLLKFEAGVHRVQRIPSNDVKIQTSAASVIILPEAEDIDVEIRPQDLKIDVFRSQGAGGQSVNKTESAVRFTHIPTGIVVSMQDERSQIQNRAKAMRYLKAKLYDHEKRKMMSARSELRSLAGGTGDRSDKIRTYNFPQDRVTDHRVGVTITGVNRVLEGEELDTIIEALVKLDDKERVERFLENLENSRKSEKVPRPK